MKTDPGSVLLAYVHPGTEVAHSFMDSTKHLLFFDASTNGRIMRGGELKMRCGTGGIVEARNKCAQKLLDGDAEWLFFVDTDMGFKPDSLERLLAVADKDERPIVGGLCFASIEKDVDGYGGYKSEPRPTIMEPHEVDGKNHLIGRGWYVPGEVTQCAGTGCAFIVIHRSVFERLHAEYGPTWFDKAKLPNGTSALSEDLSFCARASSLGIPIIVHTGVKTTHMKPIWLSEPYYWTRMTAPPAVEPVAVLVPVMERPQNAEPFMQSLRASTGLATAYAICDAADTETWRAWYDAGATMVEAETGPTFAQKVNVGYRKSHERLLFLTGDDVRFHPGWLDHAELIAAVTGAAVVGTNDLGNPRVIEGDHATHMLISRGYVEETGASWDGPGVVCHEGYRHWFVDDEIVTAAKQRNTWAPSLGSVVEHLHPIWKKGEPDAVYELGQSHAKEDGRLFKGRLRAYARELVPA